MRQVTLSGLCRAGGISRQAYYQGRRQRQRATGKTEGIMAAVRTERLLQPRVGGRKLQHLLQAGGLEVGRDTLFRLLGEHDLLVRPKRKTVRTTYYDDTLPVYRNLLYHHTPTQPHQVWVSDVTFIDTDEGFTYLSLVTDLVSRRIVGWNAGQTNAAADCIKALEQAIAQLPKECRPIHHSDRGSQYCCHQYVAVLNARGLAISMTEQNHCYENCYAERVNGILKDEFNLDAKFRTRAQAQRAIAQAIHTYNTRRPHTSLQLRTPDQAHQLAA
jgi:transposase InsO family protein